ncbi:SSI family serine proteinase inhibitor [Streptomyces olivaceus]
MRNTARRAATPGLAVTAVCGPLAETSPASPAAAPVVVTVDGVWEGRRLSYERTFANECLKNATGAGVFAF